jgi:uncharacterized phiE125 gp8 family phage protein
MILKLKTAPSIEPVDLDELKNHLRLDTDTEDAILASYLLAARTHVEALCGPLITQTWYQYEDEFPGGDILKIGKPRLQSVTSITYIDVDSVSATLASTEYAIDDENEYAPRVVLEDNGDWPTTDLHPKNPVCVEFVCGYGDDTDDVPEPIRLSIMLLVSHFYENREPVNVGQSVTAIPFTMDSLLTDYRAW